MKRPERLDKQQWNDCQSVTILMGYSHTIGIDTHLANFYQALDKVHFSEYTHSG